MSSLHDKIQIFKSRRKTWVKRISIFANHVQQKLFLVNGKRTVHSCIILSFACIGNPQKSEDRKKIMTFFEPDSDSAIATN